MTCIGVYRWADQVFCIRTTAIQTVQPACLRADTCGTEEAPPSGAAAKAVRAPRTCEPRIHGRCFGTDVRIDLDPDPRLRRECTDSLGSNPHDILLTFVGTCALMFGVGAALTGLVFKLTEACPSGGGYFGSNSSFKPNAP